MCNAFLYRQCLCLRFTGVRLMFADRAFHSPIRNLPSLPTNMQPLPALPRDRYELDSDVGVERAEEHESLRSRMRVRIPPNDDYGSPPSFRETPSDAPHRHFADSHPLPSLSDISSGRVPLDVSMPPRMSPSSPVAPEYTSEGILTNTNPTRIPFHSRNASTNMPSYRHTQSHAQHSSSMVAERDREPDTRTHNSSSASASVPLGAVYKPGRRKMRAHHFQQRLVVKKNKKQRDLPRTRPAPIGNRSVPSSARERILLSRPQLISSGAHDSLYPAPGYRGHVHSPSSEQPRSSTRRRKAPSQHKEDEISGRLYRSHSHHSIFDSGSSGYHSSQRQRQDSRAAFNTERAPLPPQFRQRQLGREQHNEKQKHQSTKLTRSQPKDGQKVKRRRQSASAAQRNRSRNKLHSVHWSPSASAMHIDRSRNEAYASTPAPLKLQRNRSPSTSVLKTERSRSKMQQQSVYIPSKLQRSRSPSAPAIRRDRSQSKIGTPAMQRGQSVGGSSKRLVTTDPTGIRQRPRLSSSKVLVTSDPINKQRPRSRSPSLQAALEKIRSHNNIHSHSPSQAPSKLTKGQSRSQLQTVTEHDRPRSRSPSVLNKDKSRSNAQKRSPSHQATKVKRGQSTSQFSHLQTASVNESRHPRSRSPSQKLSKGSFCFRCSWYKTDMCAV